MSSINVQVLRNQNLINVGINSTGPQGQSAYETWLSLGNTGTKQDFIDSQFDEPTRVSNENTRKQSELTRIESENLRVQAEQDRETEFDSIVQAYDNATKANTVIELTNARHDNVNNTDYANIGARLDDTAEQINSLDAEKQDGVTIIKDVDCHTFKYNREYIISNTSITADANSALNYPAEAGLWFLKVMPTLGENLGNGRIWIAISRDSGNMYLKKEVNSTFTSWYKIVTSKLTSWITATLQNGWVAFGAPYDSSVRYYKDNLGIVRLKGVVKSGTTAINTVILQLPVGYRPAQNLAFSCYSSEYSKVQIDSTGQLLFISGTNSALSLDGITFRAEQ